VHLPIFSLLVRVYQAPVAPELQRAPPYSSGRYNNSGFRLYPLEFQLMREYDEQSKIGIADVLAALFEDLALIDPGIAARTEGGKSPERVLAYIDETFSGKQSFALLDDVEAYQSLATEGLYVSVDAIFENRQDGSFGRTSDPRRYRVPGA